MTRVVAKFCLVVLAFSATAVAEIKSYTGSVELKPSRGEIRADLVITPVAQGAPITEEVLYLNKGIRIEDVDCSACSGYSFDTDRTGQYRYVEHGAPLIVTFRHPLQPGEKTRIRLKYGGGIVPDSWGVNMLTPEWTELAMYSGWYPYQPGANDFRFDLRVKTEAGYEIATNGELGRTQGRRWIIREVEPTSDIVLIASRDLHKRTVERGGVRLVFHYAPAQESAINSLARDTSTMLERYSAWFGEAPLKHATIVLNQRKRGGAYVRPRFMSMPISADERNQEADRSWLAHEVAHFWWVGADAATWEDWLNEAFAQYSALLFLRATSGQTAFEAAIKRAREKVMGAPPIWGLDRNSEKAQLVLYEKGALRLYELEEMIGRSSFNTFLARLKRERIKTTADLLACLERHTTREVRQRFERLLKDTN